MSHELGACVGRRAATAIPWILTVALSATVVLADDNKHMIRFGAQYVSPTGNAPTALATKAAAKVDVVARSSGPRFMCG